MRAWLVFVGCVAACGDNVVENAPPLERSETLFLGAHQDDDMIFMQPELLHALRDGSTTTVYATTLGPDGRDLSVFEAAKVAYGSVVGSTAWDCGMLAIGDIYVRHCRLQDRPVSLLDLGIADGGIPGDRRESLLHLIDGTVSEVSVAAGGTVTSETAIDTFAHLLEATAPSRIETLELAATHGRDHSSHMFVASIGLWASARVGYTGSITWHRGYNVETEAPNLGDELSAARRMLGYYEACADHCGPCGQPCSVLNTAHETWLARQYASTRVREASGSLALGDVCLQSTLALGDCATAANIALESSGALRVDHRCLATSAEGQLALAVCEAVPDQYWVIDSEGFVWNGRTPLAAGDMSYDHVRCLAGEAAPTCGAHLQPRWRIIP